MLSYENNEKKRPRGGDACENLSLGRCDRHGASRRVASCCDWWAPILDAALIVRGCPHGPAWLTRVGGSRRSNRCNQRGLRCAKEAGRVRLVLAGLQSCRPSPLGRRWHESRRSWARNLRRAHTSVLPRTHFRLGNCPLCRSAKKVGWNVVPLCKSIVLESLYCFAESLIDSFSDPTVVGEGRSCGETEGRKLIAEG